jgi:GPH family glycoside/pentoside/hexuronide:cation symporter
MSNERNYNFKISLREKISYGLGDTTCNIVIGLTTTLLTLFYTDYMGISPVIIGTIILVSRIFDGISDITMGIIVEKTHSKYGKARPWLLWMAAPFAISGIALFLVPAKANDMIKAIYIFVTYNLVTTVVYTAVNLPYGALVTMMTRDQHERTVTNVLRMVLSPIGRIMITAFTLPLVEKLGNTQTSWIIVTTIFCLFGMILLFICFANTKERVYIEAAQKKVPVKTGFSALIHNKYWLMSLSLWGILAFHQTATGIVLPYYCKYIFGNQNYLSTIYTAEQVAMMAGILIIPLFVQRFGKRNFALIGSFLVITGHLLFLIDTNSYPLLLISSTIKGLGEAPLFGLIFSFIADSVEYGQWKTHVRQEGMIFSAASVGSKLGAGLTSLTVGWILGLAGYIASDASEGIVEQPQRALLAISNIWNFSPFIIWGMAIILLLFYKLDKQYPSIMNELEERESRGEL